MEDLIDLSARYVFLPCCSYSQRLREQIDIMTRQQEEAAHKRQEEEANKKGLFGLGRKKKDENDVTAK